MKKTLSLIGLFLFVFTASKASAMCLFPGSESYLVANKTSAIADGSDVITITAHAGCNESGRWSYSNNDELRLIVSGANVTPSQQNNGRAAINFTVTSSVAGSKSIQMQYYGPTDLDNPVDTWNNIGSAISINFTAPEVAEVQTPATTKKSTSTRSATTPATETVPAVETPVAAATLSKINNEELSTGKSYNKGETIVLSGKAPANSIVKLYIYSELRTAETTADADGNWTYEVSGLEPGDHRVEAEVVDSTGKASEKVEIAKFSVVETASAENDQTPESKTNYVTYIIAAAALIVVAGLIVVFVLRRKKSSGLSKNSEETEDQD